MKFFHLSDLHIGLRLVNRDLSEDQAYIFSQIAGMARAEQPDAIIIAGDVYDRAIPSAEAVSLFDSLIGELASAAPSAAVMIISGNHDSAPRLDLYRGLLSRQNIHVIGQPPQGPEDHIEKVTLKDEHGPVHFYLLPYVRPSMVRRVVAGEEEEPLSYDETLRRLIAREKIDPAQRNVLVSHQFYLPDDLDAADVERADSEIRAVGNVDQVSASLLRQFDYAALGHIHKPWQLGDALHRYCGTPIACSVSEAGQKKGVVVVEMGEKGSTDTRILPLEPLRQVRRERGLLKEVLQRPSDDYVSVILTDTQDLDVIDMQDRIRAAFPNHIGIDREYRFSLEYSPLSAEGPGRDPLELCRSFLGGDLDPETESLLRDVLNTVQGVIG